MPAQTTRLRARAHREEAPSIRRKEGAAISEEHRRKIRARAVGDFERKNSHSPEAVPGSEHRSKSGKVVAYAYAIDANGTARSYTGIAGEDATKPETESGRAEALIHDRFGGRVAELSHAVAASERQVTTMAGGTVSGTENMEQVYSDKLEYAEDPYGVVGSTFYWFRDNPDSTEGDVHSFHSPAGFEPGHQAFGSGYTNNWGRVFNRWNRSQMGNTDVDYGQWNPYGTQGGSSTTAYSLSVSAGWMTAQVTAGITWSYSQPNVEVVDEFSAYNEYNQWQLKVNTGDDTRENFVGFQPSSAASMDYWDSSMGRRNICENEVKGQFADGGSARNLWSKGMFWLE
ncbi:hypothetical protein [Haladaptatus cibarius]|uniref:hypothetical protein n=1 Tax=Haladaptatus cibarius TaxID=453847 RepID=UPI001E4DC209|nr:hypothetical protein [Haladaptatus cibarius]